MYADAAPLPGGKVLVVGGFSGITEPLTAEVYDPGADEFTLTATGPGRRPHGARAGAAARRPRARRRRPGGSDVPEHRDDLRAGRQDVRRDSRRRSPPRAAARSRRRCPMARCSSPAGPGPTHPAERRGLRSRHRVVLRHPGGPGPAAARRPRRRSWRTGASSSSEGAAPTGPRPRPRCTTPSRGRSAASLAMTGAHVDPARRAPGQRPRARCRRVGRRRRGRRAVRSRDRDIHGDHRGHVVAPRLAVASRSRTAPCSSPAATTAGRSSCAPPSSSSRRPKRASRAPSPSAPSTSARRTAHGP